MRAHLHQRGQSQYRTSTARLGSSKPPTRSCCWIPTSDQWGALVSEPVGSLTLGGASGTQTLSLGRSVLTLNGQNAVNANGQLVLTLGNSTVTGAGNLTVDGALTWASRTMSGSGVTSMHSSGVLTVNGGVTLTTRRLSNASHVTWGSGNFTAGSGAVIDNLAGGTFEVSFDSRWNVFEKQTNISTLLRTRHQYEALPFYGALIN